MTIADSIILSFYYQPGGGWGNLWDSTNRGQSPMASDRLVLEFYSEELSMWVRMWDSDGMSLSEFCPLLNDTTGRQYGIEDMDFFRYVEVKVDAPGFNKRDFRFRFRAYSSVDRDLRTGGGQWHIDYVYLNYDRVSGQHPVDVAFVEATPTLTADYTRMPWRQFDASAVRRRFDVKPTNLGAEAARIDYRYVLRDAAGTALYGYPSDSAAVALLYPFEQRGYATEPILSPVVFDYDFGDWLADGFAADEVAETSGETGVRSYRLEHIVRYKGGLDASSDTGAAGPADFFTQRHAGVHAGIRRRVRL